MASVEVAVAGVWRLVTMVRRGTVFSHAAFRYVDRVIGAIVTAALVWFAVSCDGCDHSENAVVDDSDTSGLTYMHTATRHHAAEPWIIDVIRRLRFDDRGLAPSRGRGKATGRQAVVHGGRGECPGTLPRASRGGRALLYRS